MDGSIKRHRNSRCSSQESQCQRRKACNRCSFHNRSCRHTRLAAIDLSGYKYIGFWIKSDIPVAANVLQLVLDETAACASPDETLNIPVLAAGLWRYVRVAVTGAGTTRDALISVGINAASDPGAATLFIDDIRAGNEYLGIADDMQDKDAYAQYDPVHIIDQGKAEIGLAGTALSGQYLEPVGDGKLAVSTNGVAG